MKLKPVVVMSIAGCALLLITALKAARLDERSSFTTDWTHYLLLAGLLLVLAGVFVYALLRRSRES